MLIRFPRCLDFPRICLYGDFIPILKTRLRDIYISGWHESVNSSTSLVLFKELKQNFERSSYLRVLNNTKFRNTIAKLRLSSHKLSIETGRHNKIARNERICQLCLKSDIEDEYHFILICPKLEDLRKLYIQKYYLKHPSMFKFIELLTSNNKVILTKLALYCIKGFKLRDNLLNSVE